MPTFSFSESKCSFCCSRVLGRKACLLCAFLSCPFSRRIEYSCSVTIKPYHESSPVYANLTSVTEFISGRLCLIIVCVERQLQMRWLIYLTSYKDIFFIYHCRNVLKYICFYIMFKVTMFVRFFWGLGTRMRTHEGITININTLKGSFYG